MEDIAIRLRSWVKNELQESDPAAVILQAAEEIERLRGERRWIAVSERMPEGEQRVLVFDPELDDLGLATYTQSDGWLGDDVALYEPSHWMPLPEPPEVK